MFDSKRCQEWRNQLTKMSRMALVCMYHPVKVGRVRACGILRIRCTHIFCTFAFCRWPPGLPHLHLASMRTAACEHSLSCDAVHRVRHIFCTKHTHTRIQRRVHMQALRRTTSVAVDTHACTQVVGCYDTCITHMWAPNHTLGWQTGVSFSSTPADKKATSSARVSMWATRI
jgi:hypothetical protein